jgi:hypothetical protein
MVVYNIQRVEQLKRCYMDKFKQGVLDDRMRAIVLAVIVAIIAWKAGAWPGALAPFFVLAVCWILWPDQTAALLKSFFATVLPHVRDLALRGLEAVNQKLRAWQEPKAPPQASKAKKEYPFKVYQGDRK